MKLPNATAALKCPSRWSLLLMPLLAIQMGCGGPNTCECLQEAEKENPDQALMDKCRAAFSKMEMEEIQKTIQDCGK
ncbi:MAG: hypothetical protein RLZZ165_1506 [Bacteroidota bacterium]|jgi:hypothetical protein